MCQKKAGLGHFPPGTQGRQQVSPCAWGRTAHPHWVLRAAGLSLHPVPPRKMTAARYLPAFRDALQPQETGTGKSPNFVSPPSVVRLHCPLQHAAAPLVLQSFFLAHPPHRLSTYLFNCFLACFSFPLLSCEITGEWLTDSFNHCSQHPRETSTKQAVSR